METLSAIIEFLLYISIAVSAVRIYLILNKLWSRRQNKEVAESISVMALGLTYLTTVPFFVHQLLIADYERAVQDAMRLGSTTVLLMIGTGFWLPERRGAGFWRALRGALSLERSEAANLLRAPFQPGAAREVVGILARLAVIDRELDERERKFVESIAEQWRIEVDWGGIEAERHYNAGRAFQVLRGRVAGYLRTRPPVEQVRQVQDAVRALAGTDDKRAEEEETILGELDGMFDVFCREGVPGSEYLVVVVPDDDRQLDALRSLVPEVEPVEVAGGRACVAGVFTSERYATMVRDQYRALTMLCFVETRAA